MCQSRGRTTGESCEILFGKISARQQSLYFRRRPCAQEAVPTLARVNFDCIVLEDREDLQSRNYFRGREGRGWLIWSIWKKYAGMITSDDYICVMTRGHQHDFLVEKQILRTPASYIGVIGSRKKKEAVFAKLRQEGIQTRIWQGSRRRWGWISRQRRQQK